MDREVTLLHKRGHIYRFVSLPLALICFILFSVWPASARMVYGWFFDFF